MNELAQIKPYDGRFSPEENAEIHRLIQELKKQGRAGVLAIREFLESGQDVIFANLFEQNRPPYSSLRLALIDALAQTGGEEATAQMASMLRTTRDPEEMAFLARGLELSAPIVHRAEIQNTVLTMLNQTLKTTTGQYAGLVHLFDMIREYGDASLAIELENIYRESPPASAGVALMALAKLPEGEGIPTLIKVANEISGNPEAYGTKYEEALRMLSQASRDHPEAGEALLRLAKTNRIGTAAFIQIAAPLGGTEPQLFTKPPTPSQPSYSEIYTNGAAAATWSDAEIDQRLRLIDQLLRTNPQPEAVKALEEARRKLLSINPDGLSPKIIKGQ